MAFHGLSVLAVIPARGGSKGIPRKNLEKISGLSLVAHAAKIATSLQWIDAAIISTDDEEIAREGQKYGLDAPFLRPQRLADDKALSNDMWRHAWLTSEEHYQKKFDLSVLLEPTSPFRTVEDVSRTVDTLFKNDAQSAATISPTPSHYAPEKALTVTDNGKIGFYIEKGPRHLRRQNLPSYYHRNGICYAVRRNHLIEQGRILDQNTVAVIIDRHVVNIDSQFDLRLSKWLFREIK